MERCITGSGEECYVRPIREFSLNLRSASRRVGNPNGTNLVDAIEAAVRSERTLETAGRLQETALSEACANCRWAKRRTPSTNAPASR